MNYFNELKLIRCISTKQSGFSLLELMIVVVIIGILAKIAMPAYTASVQRSYRTDAKTALLDLASREEKYFSINNQYGSLANIYPGVSGTSMNVQSGSTAFYSLSVTTTAATATTIASFVAQAAPISGTSQANDPCGTFQITSTGVTSNIGATISPCW